MTNGHLVNLRFEATPHFADSKTYYYENTIKPNGFLSNN